MAGMDICKYIVRQIPPSMCNYCVSTKRLVYLVYQSQFMTVLCSIILYQFPQIHIEHTMGHQGKSTDIFLSKQCENNVIG